MNSIWFIATLYISEFVFRLNSIKNELADNKETLAYQKILSEFI